MITKEQIEKAKVRCRLSLPPHHEHDDCIRIAYEWLDAQKKTKQPRNIHRALKHIIENWGGRYVSQTDVEVAAYLHPDISGKYPYYNISLRLTDPMIERLDDIGEAFTQNQRRYHQAKDYRIIEEYYAIK